MTDTIGLQTFFHIEDFTYQSSIFNVLFSQLEPRCQIEPSLKYTPASGNSCINRSLLILWRKKYTAEHYCANASIILKYQNKYNAIYDHHNVNSFHPY